MIVCAPLLTFFLAFFQSSFKRRYGTFHNLFRCIAFALPSNAATPTSAALFYLIFSLPPTASTNAITMENKSSVNNHPPLNTPLRMSFHLLYTKHYCIMYAYNMLCALYCNAYAMQALIVTSHRGEEVFSTSRLLLPQT